MLNRSRFFITGVISISIYVGIIFFFFIYSLTNHAKKIGLNSKETFLELEVVNLKSQKINKIKSVKSYEKSVKSSGKLSVKTKSVGTKRVSNLKSLFAKVKTDAIKVNNSSINIKKSNTISRYKSKFEKQRKAEISKLLRSIESSNAKKHINSDKNYDVDAYYSKIKEILTLRWYTWNSIVINELTAKVRVFIDINGRFSYRIIKRFGNSIVDENLENFLDSQTLKTYPKPPKKSVDIEIIFKLEKE